MTGYELRYGDGTVVPGVHQDTCFARREDAEASILELETDPTMGDEWQAAHLYVAACHWGTDCPTNGEPCIGT